MKKLAVVDGLLFAFFALVGCQISPIRQSQQSTPLVNAETLLATPINAGADMDAPIANIVSGKVLDVVSDTLLVNTGIDGQYHIQILPATRIWKGNWDNNDRIVEIGDEVMISGTIDGQSKIGVAQQMYVNIVNTYGLISDVEEQATEIHFVIHDAYTAEAIRVKIDRKQLVAVAQSGEIAANAVDWQKVKRGQVVGLRLKDATVQGETVFVDYE